METAETFYGPALARRGVILAATRHAEFPLHLARFRDGSTVEPRGDTVVGSPIAVVVNHGRWLIECPGIGCSGAQHASRDDHRFFCTDCHNAWLDTRWAPTVWPDDPDAIDAALAVRPVEYRNWNGEPLDVLLADNADPVNGA